VTEKRAGWFKSSHSATNGSCVEVRFADDTTDVRDSKHPASEELSFPRTAWAAFLAGVR
jgi:uncharacterized protein DUF397